MTSARMQSLSLSIGIVLMGTAAGHAAPPKDATGQCVDGTYTTAKTKDKGCTKHGGVKTWFGATAPSAASAAPSAAAVPATAATPAVVAAPAVAATAKTAPAAAPARTPAEPGQVWVNTATKVYHCPGAKYYGTTKEGKFMSESDAKAAGYHADHGKACS